MSYSYNLLSNWKCITGKERGKSLDDRDTTASECM